MESNLTKSIVFNFIMLNSKYSTFHAIINFYEIILTVIISFLYLQEEFRFCFTSTLMARDAQETSTNDIYSNEDNVYANT